MMSPGQNSEGRGSSHSIYSRPTPLRIIHFSGNFLRIWSIYSMFNYISSSGTSGVRFIFSCLIPSTFIFLAMLKPWRGRPLSSTQVVPCMINGAITALYFILWAKGVKACGPLRAILAEYSGAVLGVLSAALYGQGSHVLKKVAGLVAILASFYLLSLGWAMDTHSPFSFSETVDSEERREQVPGMNQMIIPIFAGILSAVRRVIARRTSLKNQLKKRLHAITMASATCFMFPVAMWDLILGKPLEGSEDTQFSTWPYLSTVVFGIILIFYVESIAEERLHMVFSSPRHLMVAGASIIVMEIVYGMDFSLVGFIFCCVILGFGIYQATALDRPRRGDSHSHAHDLSDGPLEDHLQMSSLPT